MPTPAHALLQQHLRRRDAAALAEVLAHPPASPDPAWLEQQAAAERWLSRESAHLETLRAIRPPHEIARLAAQMGDVWYAAELADPRRTESYGWYEAAGVLSAHRDVLEAVAADPVWHAEQRILLGDFEAARGILAGQSSPEAAAWRARLRLWAAQDPRPELTVEGIPAAERDDLIGGWLVLSGAHEAALSLLLPGAEGTPSSARLAWIAEALMGLGREDEAPRWAERARASERQTHVPLVVLAHWTRRPKRRPKRVRPDVRRMLEAVWAPAPVPRSYALRESLRRLGGHRGSGLVVLEDGALVRRPLPLLGNLVGAHLRSVIRSRGYRAAKEAFAAVHRREEQAEARIYEGELDLWYGDYDEAERVFRRALALEPDTKWAWIGLGACFLLRGEPARAIDVWARRFVWVPTLPYRLRLFHWQTPGPTLWIYLAEALWRLGKHEAAMATAGACVRDKPRRVSALLLVGRLQAEQGDGALLRDALAALGERVPGLRLAARLGEGSPEEAHDRLLAAWRGNRSSATLTWRRGAHIDSFVHPGPEPSLIARAREASQAAWGRHRWRS